MALPAIPAFVWVAGLAISALGVGGSLYMQHETMNQQKEMYQQQLSATNSQTQQAMAMQKEQQQNQLEQMRLAMQMARENQQSNIDAAKSMWGAQGPAGSTPYQFAYSGSPQFTGTAPSVSGAAPTISLASLYGNAGVRQT